MDIRRGFLWLGWCVVSHLLEVGGSPDSLDQRLSSVRFRNVDSGQRLWGSVPPSVSGLFPLSCGTSCDSVPSPLAEGPYFDTGVWFLQVSPLFWPSVVAAILCRTAMLRHAVGLTLLLCIQWFYPTSFQSSVVALLYMAGHVACGAWFLDFAFVSPCVTAFRDVHRFCGAVTVDQHQRLDVLHFCERLICCAWFSSITYGSMHPLLSVRACTT